MIGGERVAPRKMPREAIITWTLITPSVRPATKKWTRAASAMVPGDHNGDQSVLIALNIIKAKTAINPAKPITPCMTRE